MKAPVSIHFEITPYMLEDVLIARLPGAASKQLPSRGQVAVAGKIDEHEVLMVLEPDGDWGHWFYITKDMQAAGVREGVSVMLNVNTIKDWPEPKVPADIAKALNMAPQNVTDKWQDITPMARWEWVRWVNETGSDATRAIRIEKTISKLAGKHRRPCCFNLAGCTDPKLSKSGRLIGITPNVR